MLIPIVVVSNYETLKLQAFCLNSKIYNLFLRDSNLNTLSCLLGMGTRLLMSRPTFLSVETELRLRPLIFKCSQDR